MKTSFAKADVRLFRQDPITEQMLSHNLGADMGLFDALLDDLEIKALFNKAVRATTVGTKGLLGLRFAKTFAMIAYEGVASGNLLRDERQAAILGCLFAIMARSHAVNMGVTDDDVFLIPLVEDWLESRAGAKLSEVTKHLVIDICCLGLPYMPTGSQSLSPLEKIVIDAFFMALGTGTDKEITDRAYQYMNFRTGRYPMHRYDAPFAAFGWSARDFDNYAKAYLAIDDLLEFKVYAPKTKWGVHRWFAKNYSSVFKKVK